MKSIKKIYLLLLTILGLILIAFLCFSVGFQNIVNLLREMGFRFAIVLAIALGWHVLNTWGWHFVLPPYRNIPFFKKFKIKLKTEAFNTLTPFASSGGEPLRIWFTQNYYSLEEGTISVVLDKSIHILSGFCFALIGFVISLQKIDGQNTFSLFAALLICLMVGWIVIHLLKKNSKVQGMIAHAFSFYRFQKGRFFLSAGCHMMGWILGMLEIYIILLFMGHPLSILNAYLITAFLIILHTFSSFIPSSLGVSEGGLYLLFSALGLNPAIGFTVGLARRLRSIFWSLIGILL